MVALLGVMGLVLALVGLYAVVSYNVGRRTREIGIRMALGAARHQVLGMVLKSAATMALAGVGMGTALFTAGNLAMKGTYMAEIIGSLSPVLFGTILVSLLATTLMAAAIPARHASRIDPQQALRQE
jgi:ABC-type antimicrobial peptide transport system permease subunit